MLLLGDNDSAANAKEMEYCIRESMDNLKTASIFTSFESHCSGELPLKFIVEAYDFYEMLTEQFLDDMTAMMVALSCKNGKMHMRVQIGCSEKIMNLMPKSIPLHFGRFVYEIDDEDIWVNYSIAEGEYSK